MVTLCLRANNFLSSGFMDQVEDAKIEITSDDLPSFLYETGTVYNPENEATGLFRGFLLVRVSTYLFTFHYEHFFFSARSIGIFLQVPLQQWTQKKPAEQRARHVSSRSWLSQVGQLRTHAFKQVFVFLIYFSISNPQKAYVALSGMKQWNTSDNLFYLDEFYDNIVSMIEDNGESSWAEELLNWWHE